MILHILNGDCALDGWYSAGFSGEVLVWRENYLTGIIPETADLTAFNRIHAEELHKTAPEKTPDEIFEELQHMHEKLFSLRSKDKLVLWLDFCPFDQALLKRLLELVSGMPDTPEIFSVQQDVVWNKEAFVLYRNWQEYRYTAI